MRGIETMCNCRNMVRTTDGNEQFPMSNHHTKCEDYELIEFVKIIHKEDRCGFIETKDQAFNSLNPVLFI